MDVLWKTISIFLALNLINKKVIISIEKMKLKYIDNILKNLNEKRRILGYRLLFLFYFEVLFRIVLSRVLKKKVKIFTGKCFFLKRGDIGLSVDLYIRKIREPVSMKKILKILEASKSKKKIFLDVGANIGYYSVCLSPFFNKVIAIEPDRGNIQILRKNIRKLKNVKIIEGAVSYSSKPLFLVRKLEKNLSFTSENKGEEMILNVFAFDDFLKKFKPFLVKMDIEGFEYKIFKFSQMPFRPKYMFIEIHFPYLTPYQSIELLNKLKRKGYVIKYVIDDEKSLFSFRESRIIAENITINNFIKNYKKMDI